jgi:hypothetical protein
MANSSNAELYERDFYEWAFEQARRVRAGEPIDRENVAEELEDLGRSQQRALQSHLAVLLAHLIKWQFQPEKRSKSWMTSIQVQRLDVAGLLKKMPSLKRHLAETIEDAYPRGMLFAVDEMRNLVVEDLPPTCPYSVEQILDPEYLP